MELSLLLFISIALFPLYVDSGLNVKVGVKLPSINVKIPRIKLPTIKITTVIKHSGSKKPLSIKLPALSFDTEAEKEKDDWWQSTPEPWGEPEPEPETESNSGWETDPWAASGDDKVSSEHEQIDKWLAEKRKKGIEKITDSWNEVKYDPWATTDDRSTRSGYSERDSKSERSHQYPPYPYPVYPYSGWPTGGWSGWGGWSPPGASWSGWSWPSYPGPTTTPAPTTKGEKKEDPPKDDDN